MTAILTEIGNRTDPAVLQLLVNSPSLDVGSVLSFTIRSADIRRREFPPLAFSATTTFPIPLWDWLQLIHVTYDDACDFANVSFGKAEQIDDFDYRPKIQPRRDAEYVKVENLVFTPVYAAQPVSSEQAVFVIDQILAQRRWKECPVIPLITNTRVTSDADRRVISNGDVRVVREYLF